MDSVPQREGLDARTIWFAELARTYLISLSVATKLYSSYNQHRVRACTSSPARWGPLPRLETSCGGRV